MEINQIHALIIRLQDAIAAKLKENPSPVGTTHEIEGFDVTFRKDHMGFEYAFVQATLPVGVYFTLDEDKDGLLQHGFNIYTDEEEEE